jgi:transcriptional regulator with XRE-family HTH domain
MYAQSRVMVLRMEHMPEPGGKALVDLIEARIAPETLGSFAKRAGIDPSQPSRWRGENHVPRIESLRRIAKALDVPMAQILVVAGVVSSDDIHVEMPDFAPARPRAEDVVLDDTLSPNDREFLLRYIEMARAAKSRRPRNGTLSGNGDPA